MREQLWPGAYIVRVVGEYPNPDPPRQGWLNDGDYPVVSVEFFQDITFAGSAWVITNRGVELLYLTSSLTHYENGYAARLMLRKDAEKQ